MRKILILIAFILLLVQCGQNSSEPGNSEAEMNNITDAKSSLKIQQSDTFITDQSCVVFLMPDSTEIDRMQKENSEEDYAEIVADITWYPGVAGEVLDSFKIINKYVDNQHFLLFKLKNGKSVQLDKRKTEGNMILFRNDTLPVISYAIDFDREYTLKFFKK